ncbi:MAG: hypothetical protein K2K15_02590, partial [Anaeroplasmataceae bacterium]|nr:hypothetical protein [Anaeroplasmataceae bacterium]
YNIVGILIGAIIVFNFIFSLVTKREKIGLLMLHLFCAVGLISTGITGFFISKELEYIIILLLLFFSILFLVVSYIILKKRKSSQKQVINSR